MDVSPDRPKASRFAVLLGSAYLKLAGWRIVGDPPPDPKMVFVAAPHTSNWDLVYMLAAGSAMGLRLSWFGKDSLFRFPFGTLARWLGGIPVDRSKHTHLVQQVAELFHERRGLCLGVPPEGTRSRVEFWKSGFYYIALEAKVPIALSYLDYGTKTCGFRDSFTPTGDAHGDMERVRAAYQGVVGKHPENQSVPRLKEEAANA